MEKGPNDCPATALTTVARESRYAGYPHGLEDVGGTRGQQQVAPGEFF